MNQAKHAQFSNCFQNNHDRAHQVAYKQASVHVLSISTVIICSSILLLWKTCLPLIASIVFGLFAIYLMSITNLFGYAHYEKRGLFYYSVCGINVLNLFSFFSTFSWIISMTSFIHAIVTLYEEEIGEDFIFMIKTATTVITCITLLIGFLIMTMN